MTARTTYPRAARVFYATACLLAVAAAYVAHAAIPPNPVRLPGEDDVRAGMFVPEGWAFFTKTPRTPEVLVYRRTADGGWRDVHAPRLSSAGRLNLSRDARAQGVEMGLLLHGLPNDAWTTCDEQVTGCLDTVEGTRTVRNTVPRPTICGDAGFAQRQRVPWSFRNTTTPGEMPSIVLRLRVTCP